MHKGIFSIKINQFRPLGGIMPINATITLKPPLDPVFSIHGNNITIKIPKGDTSPVEMVFKLHSTQYLLIGIAFTDPRGGVGQDEFPVVKLEPDVVGAKTFRKMSLLDADGPQDQGVFYDYVILVQSVATGEIGIIDPGVESDGGD
jgi:hypothetical protein